MSCFELLHLPTFCQARFGGNDGVWASQIVEITQRGCHLLNDNDRQYERRKYKSEILRTSIIGIFTS